MFFGFTCGALNYKLGAFIQFGDRSNGQMTLPYADVLTHDRPIAIQRVSFSYHILGRLTLLLLDRRNLLDELHNIRRHPACFYLRLRVSYFPPASPISHEDAPWSDQRTEFRPQGRG